MTDSMRLVLNDVIHQNVVIEPGHHHYVSGSFTSLLTLHLIVVFC